MLVKQLLWVSAQHGQAWERRGGPLGAQDSRRAGVLKALMMNLLSFWLPVLSQGVLAEGMAVGGLQIRWVLKVQRQKEEHWAQFPLTSSISGPSPWGGSAYVQNRSWLCYSLWKVNYRCPRCTHNWETMKVISYVREDCTLSPVLSFRTRNRLQVDALTFVILKINRSALNMIFLHCKVREIKIQEIILAEVPPHTCLYI